LRAKGTALRANAWAKWSLILHLTGYQEIATDPSYAGQIVVLTNPQIGNYGTNQADNEAAKPYIEGLIVREFSAVSSNWRSEQVTDEYMERFQGSGAGGDRHARAGAASAHPWRDARRDLDSETNPEKLVAKARSIRKMDGTDLARVVSTKTVFGFRRFRQPATRRRQAAALGRTPRRRASRCCMWWRTTSASSGTFCAC
jgi:carbamoyl-phosphate synthase small subunit